MKVNIKHIQRDQLPDFVPKTQTVVGDKARCAKKQRVAADTGEKQPVEDGNKAKQSADEPECANQPCASDQAKVGNAMSAQDNKPENTESEKKAGGLEANGKDDGRQAEEGDLNPNPNPSNGEVSEIQEGGDSVQQLPNDIAITQFAAVEFPEGAHVSEENRKEAESTVTSFQGSVSMK